MKNLETFRAEVYVGLREGYDGPVVHSLEEVEYWCQEYVDRVGLCVNVTPCKFVYTGGGEPGARIELINYPRFPSTPQTIKNHAYSIAQLLMTMMKQKRCTIVCTDKTYMLESEDV
jgi:hypothetical protein